RRYTEVAYIAGLTVLAMQRSANMRGGKEEGVDGGGGGGGSMERKRVVVEYGREGGIVMGGTQTEADRKCCFIPQDAFSILKSRVRRAIDLRFHRNVTSAPISIAREDGAIFNDRKRARE
ncbi:hypothetical protein BaRGS_00028172, partial [Batillaria attramentaria]